MSNIAEYFKETWKWYVLNLVLLPSAIAGWYYGMEGPKNIAYFILWVYGVFGVLIFIGAMLDALDDVIKQKASEARPYAVPKWFDLTTDLFLLGTIVWFGHWVLGIFYTISIIAHLYVRDKIENYLFEQLKQGT